MAEAEQFSRVNYEPALRIIGRHLDAEPTYHLSVVEGDEGFTVRSQSSKVASEGRTIEFSWPRLNNLLIYHTAGRGLQRRHHRHLGIWDAFPNGHEDFFRALGFNLDKEGASGLSVDEVPDGITVSYQRPPAGNRESNDLERVELHFGKAEIQRMLEGAQARREAGEEPVGSLSQGE